MALAMGRTVTASSDRRPRERTVPPSGWEHEVRDRVVAGDDTALREVYDQYASFVYGLAARVIGDTRAAEDVSQDVFVAFWERPDAFDPDRGQPPDLAGHPDPPPRRRPRAPRGGAPPSRRARGESCGARRPTSRRWRPRCSPPSGYAPRSTLLPPDQRRAIQLAYFGGKTYRQVAETLGIPEGTAKSRLRLALRRIADALEAEGDEW